MTALPEEDLGKFERAGRLYKIGVGNLHPSPESSIAFLQKISIVPYNKT
jgi:hypothetical protein